MESGENRKMRTLLNTYPVLWFCVTFAVLFAFMIGVTTPNFGAMVRFKIPLLPFFAVFLIVVWKSDQLLPAKKS